MAYFNLDRALLDRVKKFLVVGVSALAVQLCLMTAFVEGTGCTAHLFMNLGNLITGEMALIYAFFLNRNWTWKVLPSQRERSLLRQLALYHAANGLGLVLRLALFAVLDIAGVHYTINLITSVGIVSVLSFGMYNKFVFAKQANHLGSVNGLYDASEQTGC